VGETRFRGRASLGKSAMDPASSVAREADENTRNRIAG
jgi:hypothetical protein